MMGRAEERLRWERDGYDTKGREDCRGKTVYRGRMNSWRSYIMRKDVKKSETQRSPAQDTGDRKVSING